MAEMQEKTKMKREVKTAMEAREEELVMVVGVAEMVMAVGDRRGTKEIVAM